MQYEVIVSRRILRRLGKMPRNIQERFDVLAQVLRAGGATAPHYWRNYGKLGKNRYHCHLTYGHVACWYSEKGTITIEVYYVGSREDAPY